MQQSAVEWQFEQLFNSFEKFNNGEYSFKEYLKRNLEIREEAKEMEKHEKITFALKVCIERAQTHGGDALEIAKKLINL